MLAKALKLHPLLFHSPSFSCNTLNGCSSSCLAHSTTPNLALPSSSNALRTQRKKKGEMRVWHLGDYFIKDKNEKEKRLKYPIWRWKTLPQSERHRIKASLHLTEECPRCLHLQAIHLVGVSFVNGGPLTSILCLSRKTEHIFLNPRLYQSLKIQRESNFLSPSPLQCW